jgi:hypothetical protein
MTIAGDDKNPLTAIVKMSGSLLTLATALQDPDAARL